MCRLFARGNIQTDILSRTSFNEILITMGSPITNSLTHSLPGIIFATAVLVCGIPFANAGADVDPDKVYQMRFQAELDPEAGHAHVTLDLEQHRRLLRSIELVMPPDRYLNIRPTSQIEVDGDRVVWRPLKRGSKLQYDFVIAHNRDNGESDARITNTWALLKLDNLFPRASARVIKGATSASTMELLAPQGWAIETPYGPGAGKILDVSNPDRLYDRPLGWLLAGELGVRRDTVKNRKLSVASPLGSGTNANDMLAFLRWTLPSLIEVVPEFPQRLLIVSGSKDMWRGGLSGVGSLYLHGDRPLISGNRTSPMLHEIFHAASRLYGKDGADWIVEGLAEYYSLELLRRSGGISEYRYNEALESLARWSDGTQCVATDHSKGKLTAHATLVMRALDSEIRTATDDKESLDTVVQMLVRADKTITNADFREAASQLIEGPVRSLANCP
jgi:hypothetical protein